MIIGDDRQIVIPELTRFRKGSSRLTGLRCIHTHIKDEAMTQDDINDLLLLRLDVMVVVNVLPDGSAGKITLAHISAETKGKRYLVHGPDSLEKIETLYSGLISQIETELERKATPTAVKGKQKVMLIHVSSARQEEMQSSLDELEELARTAGMYVADSITQKRPRPDPKYLIGKGKLKDFMIQALSHDIDLLIFDTELTPAQIKSIADFADINVIDRTQLILGIFEKRANSRDGKVRVKLAQMKYLLPRLSAKESALSRIRGGIGLRGPGETTAQVQKRMLETKITKLEKELIEFEKQREVKRRARIRSGVKIISIIGYTNAGKSTLLNRLTGSSLFVEDLLFATLDPAARKLRLPGGTNVVASDTVGLIRNMPESVAGAFRATFEELEESDLLINLIDLSDHSFEKHIKTTEKTLEELGLNKIRRLTVFNKTEKLEKENTENICERHDAIAISAKEGKGIGKLLMRAEEMLGEG